jgi:hypothetical protein
LLGDMHTSALPTGIVLVSDTKKIWDSKYNTYYSLLVSTTVVTSPSET